MVKILISGYYGFDNQGDEAILKALVKDIRGNIDDAEITVLTANASQTKKEFNVKVVNRNRYLGTIKEIIKSDIIISGGGSLLQDITSPRSLYYYLMIIFLSAIFQKKTLLVSHGIGPIQSKFHRKLTRFVLNKVDYISVREKHSKENLLEMGLNDDIIVTADPVIELSSVDLKSGKTIINERTNSKTIGISLRSVDFINQERYEELIKFITLASKTVDIVFMPFHLQQDVEILTRIKNDLRNYKNLQFLEKRYSIDDMLSLMGNFDLFIGERLHSLIFASVVYTPIIGISYDPKINYFLNTLSMKPIFDIENFESDILFEEMNNMLLNDGHIDSYKKNIDTLKGKFKKNTDAIYKFANAIRKQ